MPSIHLYARDQEDIELCERRASKVKKLDLWDLLTPEQQFSACSLGATGFVLKFVRKVGDCHLAVFKRGSKVATVNCDGYINNSPQINLRKRK